MMVNREKILITEGKLMPDGIVNITKSLRCSALIVDSVAMVPHVPSNVPKFSDKADCPTAASFLTLRVLIVLLLQGGPLLG